MFVLFYLFKGTIVAPRGGYLRQSLTQPVYLRSLLKILQSYIGGIPLFPEEAIATIMNRMP